MVLVLSSRKTQHIISSNYISLNWLHNKLQGDWSVWSCKPNDIFSMILWRRQLLHTNSNGKQQLLSLLQLAWYLVWASSLLQTVINLSCLLIFAAITIILSFVLHNLQAWFHRQTSKIPGRRVEAFPGSIQQTQKSKKWWQWRNSRGKKFL